MIMTPLQKLQRRRKRIRSRISGTAERPRLAVHISNKHVTAQLIDDVAGTTLAQAHSKTAGTTGSLTVKSAAVGEAIGAAAKKRGIKSVVFDRGGRLYHTRMHALAEAARNQGLEF